MVAVSKDDFIKQLFPNVVTATSPSSSSSSSRTKKLALVSIGSKFRVSVILYNVAIKCM